MNRGYSRSTQWTRMASFCLTNPRETPNTCLDRLYIQILGAKIQKREGNNPDRTLRSLRKLLSGKRSDRAMTITRWDLEAATM
uniref:Putative ovule protein n=1 Tax=Solanum chacoense TaxID=4108 RepID=A0A0V0H992_SOLCH